MKLTYKEIISDQFKGNDHSEYKLFPRTLVEGYNASGKTTTFADVPNWIIADRDYNLTSNPEVHNMNKSESEPSGIIVCDIDGKEVTIRKFQKDSRTKKQKDSGDPVRISNQYEINSVPKSQKDFIEALKEYGIDVDKFLWLSHPDVFMDDRRMSVKDRRSILFGMTSDITDMDISETLGFEELTELLGNYKLEEVIAMKKREQKEANENLDAIPEQIIGMEKSKVVINEEEFRSQRDTLQAEVNALEEKIMAVRLPSVGDLNQEIIRLEQEGKSIIAAANSERVAKLTEMNALIGDLRVKFKYAENDKARTLEQLEQSMADRTASTKRYEELASEFQSVKAEEFDGTKRVCPQCGQDLPIVQIEKLRVRFEEMKEQRKAEINKEALGIKKKVASLTTRIHEYEQEIKAIDKNMDDTRAEIERLSKEREKYEHVIDATGSKEYSNVLSKIAEVQHTLNRRDELVVQEESIRVQIRDKKEAIREIDDQLAQLKVNDRIDQKIAEAKQLQTQYAQAEASAQRILDQVSAVSMKKNQMLTDGVNSHFNLVKFKLFERQKNGEFKDCCIPMIRNENGEYMEFGRSANTALEVMGKLDIISGLQDFYNQHIPVIADGMECLDAKTMASLSMPDTQLITLSVANTPLTVKDGGTDAE